MNYHKQTSPPSMQVQGLGNWCKRNFSKYKKQKATDHFCNFLVHKHNLSGKPKKQIKQITRELLTEHPRTAMIGIVYEYVIIRTTVNNLPTTSFNSSFVPKDSSKKVANGNIFPCIILPQENKLFEEKGICIQTCTKWRKETNLWNSLVNIITMRTVNNDSRPRVLFVESNVVIHENNNVFILNAAFLQDLIRMTYISLKHKHKTCCYNHQPKRLYLQKRYIAIRWQYINIKQWKHIYVIGFLALDMYKKIIGKLR